jgi:dnd system-associated protein 4
MREIRRPDATEHVVDRLTDPHTTGTGMPVFPTIIELLIFCAGVGLSLNRPVAVPSSGKGLPLRLFENQHNDGYLYLVALAVKKDPAILSGEHDDEVAKIFEEYAAGGLEEVATWLAANPTDISGVQALITQIQSQIAVAAPPPLNPNPL